MLIKLQSMAGGRGESKIRILQKNFLEKIAIHQYFEFQG